MFEDVLLQENNHQIDEDFHKHRIDKEDVHHLYYLLTMIFVLAQESTIDEEKNSFRNKCNKIFYPQMSLS